MIRIGRAPVLFLMLGVLLAPCTAMAHGAKEPPTVWLEGELVDLACYVAHGARGSDNALCASQRSSRDQPVALLTEDGTLVVLWADHHSTQPFDLCRQRLGEKVRLGGAQYKHGNTTGMEVREVKKVESTGDRADR